MSDASIRTAFALQADWARLIAPFTARLSTLLARVVDRSTAVGVRVLDWPGEPLADALVLRLLGGCMRWSGRESFRRSRPPTRRIELAAMSICRRCS